MAGLQALKTPRRSFMSFPPCRVSSSVPPARRGETRPLPQCIPPQLPSRSNEPPSGPTWLHEIKLDGFRMAARIERGRASF